MRNVCNGRYAPGCKYFDLQEMWLILFVKGITFMRYSSVFHAQPAAQVIWCRTLMPCAKADLCYENDINCQVNIIKKSTGIAGEQQQFIVIKDKTLTYRPYRQCV